MAAAAATAAAAAIAAIAAAAQVNRLPFRVERRREMWMLACGRGAVSWRRSGGAKRARGGA